MGLEYIHAALLLHEAKKDITDESISKIVEAAGIKADKAMAKATTENLKDVDIEDVLTSAVAAPVAGAPAQAQGAGEAGGEEKKEKPKESEEAKEKKSEEAAAGLSSLFG
ncbi:MAG: 50S ribosomal protein P1 [Candidatus Aenigmarchaeota archaeon]|nr:50S ribosomal protein P1 [Candidatus Aenigmarchaeota archaeon]